MEGMFSVCLKKQEERRGETRRKARRDKKKGETKEKPITAAKANAFNAVATTTKNRTAVVRIPNSWPFTLVLPVLAFLTAFLLRCTLRGRNAGGAGRRHDFRYTKRLRSKRAAVRGTREGDASSRHRIAVPLFHHHPTQELGWRGRCDGDERCLLPRGARGAGRVRECGSGG